MMASKPFMKLYISDYLTDTHYLTALEHGCYLLLIMNYFQTGKSLPDNDKKLASICKLSEAKFSKVKTVLKELFLISEGQWFHKRIEKELDEMYKKSETARVSAMQRWSNEGQNTGNKNDANALRMHCERNSNAMLSDTEADSDTETETLFMSGKPDDAKILKAKNLKKDAIEVLDFLNERLGKNFRKVDANLSLIIARLNSGVTVSDCRGVIARKRREWISDPFMFKFLRPKTIFNKTNFEQYLGEKDEL